MKALKGNLPLLLLSAVIGAGVLWPLPLSPHPHDHADTLFNTWLIAWNHHAVTSGRNPLQTPQFAGFPDGNGRSDILLSQWLVSLPLRAGVKNPVRIHNLLFWASLSLSGFAAGKLTQDRGATAWGAAFAAGAFICLPYFQSHLWHLQLQSAGLSVAGLMFALRTVENRSSGRPLAVLIPLQGLASLYHWYFLNLSILLVAAGTLARRKRRGLMGLLLYGLAGNALMVPFLLPQLRNAARWDTDTITSTDVAAFASPWETSFVLGGLRSSHAHPEAALWPGIGVLSGFVWALAKNRGRGERCLGILGLFFAAYSLGPTIVAWGRELAPGPFRLFALLPGGTAIRLPARAGYLALLPLVVMAGKQLGKKRAWVLAGLGLTAGEALHPGVSTLPASVPEHHRWMAGQKPSRVLYLPVMPDLDRPEQEIQRLYGSILHFTPSVNGYSTSLPRGYIEAASVLNTWPSPRAVELASELGVDLLVFQGAVPEDPDMVWSDGRIRYGAIWLRI